MQHVSAARATHLDARQRAPRHAGGETERSGHCGHSVRSFVVELQSLWHRNLAASAGANTGRRRGSGIVRTFHLLRISLSELLVTQAISH